MTDNRSPDDGSSKWDEGFDPKSLIDWVVADKYRITVHLGGGGFGEVYEAVNVNLPEQRVVIKFLKRVQSRERFEREAKILCRLDHPNICRIIDYFPKERALVMPYIDGLDGRELLEQEGGLAESTFLDIARAVTAALAYAHGKSIAHRDVKPGNIMVDRNDHVYLIDFGIAKEMDATTLTGTGLMVLTPQFAAPERLNPQQQYDPFLSDIYEVGATLLKLTTGRTPFEKLQDYEARSGKSRGRRLSHRLRHILRRATQPVPSDRYKTIGAMHQELKKVTRVYRRSRWWLVAGAVVLIATVVVLFSPQGRQQVTSWFQSDTKTEDTTATVDSIPVTVIDSATPDAVETSVPPGRESTRVGIVKKQVVETETIVEKPPVVVERPEPPPSYDLEVSIEPPSELSRLVIDGIKRPTGKALSMAPGEYEIRLVHPSFPLFEDTISVNAPVSRVYNLADEFMDRPSVSLFIGAVPPDLQGGSVEIVLNGGSHKYQFLPIFDLHIPVGRWLMEFAVWGADGMGRKVDSVIARPQRYKFGPSAEVNLDTPSWRESGRVDMTIYWSNGGER